MAASSPFRIAAFFCPKAGNSADEYEDAFAIRHIEETATVRVAVADGATESSFAQTWARLLVARFAQGLATGADFFDDLDDARAQWRLSSLNRPLPWYAEEKASYGAHAAFLGLTIEAARKSWHAVAIGDCCLFQLDAARPSLRLVEALPLTRASDFGSSPYLICTKADPAEELAAHICVVQGSVRPEDIFLLASDAMAQYLLRCQEEDRPKWQMVAEMIGNQSQFDSLVAEARGDSLRNDDTTLVRVSYGG